MAEVIGRRFDEYYKAEKADEGFGKLPDLILLDGGKGQVAVVKKVLREMNIDVPLFGLVKDDKQGRLRVTAEKFLSAHAGHCLLSLAKCRTKCTALQSAITTAGEVKILLKARLPILTA